MTFLPISSSRECVEIEIGIRSHEEAETQFIISPSPSPAFDSTDEEMKMIKSHCGSLIALRSRSE
jgi:hypothetical protein